MGKKFKADIEYPFEHGEVTNYTLHAVSIHTGVLPNSVAGEDGNCSDFTLRPMVTKTVRV
jgi:hypothetical protein